MIIRHRSTKVYPDVPDGASEQPVLQTAHHHQAPLHKPLLTENRAVLGLQPPARACCQTSIAANSSTNCVNPALGCSPSSIQFP